MRPEMSARSCDPGGDRPCGPLPRPSPALRPSGPARASPSQLPPPPATIPPNFRPAFLGVGAVSTKSGSGSASPADDLAARFVRRPAASPARAAGVVRAPKPLLRPDLNAEDPVFNCKTSRVDAPVPRIRSVVVAPDPLPLAGALDAEGWTTVGSRHPPRPQRLSTFPRHDRRSAEQGSRLASVRVSSFTRRTWGRCFRCLERGHRVLHCRNPLRCLSCDHFGHRARNCTAPPPAPPQPRSSASSLGLRREGDHRSWCAVALGAPPLPVPALLARPSPELRHVADALCHEFDIRVREDIPTPRLLMDGVDGALAEENERVGPLLLTVQGEGAHCVQVESYEHVPQLPEVSGKVQPSQEQFCEQQEAEPVQEMMVALATPAIATEVVIFDSEADVISDSGVDVLDANAEAIALGCLLDVDGDVALASPGIALRSVADLFGPPAVPLLPMPLALSPRVPMVPPAPSRRSSRLATKPHLPAVNKVVRVLHKRMGLDVGDMPLEKARKEFASSLKNPLSSSAIDALTTLFRLNLPSMTAANEALIALAGPGGSDFPLPVALDVSV